MLFLTATTHKITLTCDSAGQVDFHASYNDSTTTPSLAPGSNHGQITTTTETDVVAVPGASTIRNVKQISIVNSSTMVASTIRLRFDTSGTKRYLFPAVTLGIGEALVYDEGVGFRMLDSTGRIKTTGLSVRSPSIMVPSIFATGNLTATRTVTSTESFALHVGRAPRAITSAQLRYRVTTAAATITWAEVAIAKGALALASSPSLTVVGYADVSAVINSTGQKTTTINVSAGQSIDEGDDLWVIIGNQATTAAVCRSQSIADDIQSGFSARLATQPSLNVGASQSYTVDSATATPFWMTLAVA